LSARIFHYWPKKLNSLIYFLLKSLTVQKSFFWFFLRKIDMKDKRQSLIQSNICCLMGWLKLYMAAQYKLNFLFVGYFSIGQKNRVPDLFFSKRVSLFQNPSFDSFLRKVDTKDEKTLLWRSLSFASLAKKEEKSFSIHGQEQ